MGVSLDALLDAGVHFGHRASRWNPKMRPYIYGKRNRIHIIDLVQTVKALARAKRFLTNLVSSGRAVVYVGTKPQIREIVRQEAERAQMPWVTERWLGGTLTNFGTIRSRLKRLEELEALVESGEIENYKKKEQASLLRELRRIRKNLEGIRELNRIPGALIVVDPKREYIAVREANKLGVPIVAILDTDCDPDEVDIPIPANDDAMKSVALLLHELTDGVLEGRAAARTAREAAEAGVDEVGEAAEVGVRVEMKRREAPKGARRPQRRGPSRTRSEAAPAEAGGEGEPAAEAEAGSTEPAEPEGEPPTESAATPSKESDTQPSQS